MFKRLICGLICLMLVLPLLASCKASPKQIADEYLSYLCAMDFEQAYGCFYIFGGTDVTKNQYVSELKDITKKFEIKKIALKEKKVSSTENGYFLDYTLEYQSDLKGKFEGKFSTRMFDVADSYKIEFTYPLIFEGYSKGDRIVRKVLPAQRGKILDKNGRILADNAYAQTVYIDVANVENITQVMDELSQYVEFDAKKIKKQYNSAKKNNYSSVAVKAYLPGTIEKQTKILKIKGVGIDSTSLTSMRQYEGEVSSHIVGYMGSANEKQAKALKKEGFSADMPIGKSGIEAAFEEQLRAQDGYEIVLQDYLGNDKKTLYTKPPTYGRDVSLSIDYNMQEKAYRLLQTYLQEGQRGSAIVMNPKSGQIEAMAVWPSYDNNLFNLKIPKAQWDIWQKEKTLYNWATMGSYPPGSTMKPFAVVPALESGKITPQTVFPYTISKNLWTPPNWHTPPIKRMKKTDGKMDLYNCMLNSDNIYMAYTALQTGEATFMQYIKKYGVGEKIPFELPVSKSNLMNKKTKMSKALLADMAYGQGELLFSPVQMASMYTAFVNNGDMMNPSIVKATGRPDGAEYIQLSATKKKAFKQNVLQPSTVNTLLPILVDVVAKGTGKNVAIENVDIAGKTGTAQTGEKNKEIAWFVGFWVGQNKDRLVVVCLETKEKEGSARFPIAKALLTP